MLKDYYDILQIPSYATLQEIKQAYRRLALVYHPDKSKNDPYALARYDEIREAYEVLTNPVRKENYLQERWYNQSMRKNTNSQTITPVTVLKTCLELEKHVSALDPHRMNREGLCNYISELLSSGTIGKLHQFNETDINRQIISTMLMAMKPLPLTSVTPLLSKLETLGHNDPLSLDRIAEFLWEKKRNFLWSRYQVPVILILTALICIVIYLTSK